MKRSCRESDGGPRSARGPGVLLRAERQGLGADGWGKHSLIGINMGGAFAAEVILTFLFVLVVLGATSRVATPGATGLAIGLALTTVHLVGIPITGTSVNPARSVGPALVVRGDALNQVWLFIVAPLIGGAIAAAAYYALFPREEKVLGITEEAVPEAARTDRPASV